MFEGVLPAVARWALAPDDASAAALWDAEARLVAGATTARVQEFAAGRVAARRALAALGEAPAAILAEGRRPCWPGGVVGSITHCAGLAAAAVARQPDLRALGIDAEPAVPLDDDVVDLVSSAAERRALDDALAGTIVFSAKESFYKCWSSLGGAPLEFDAVVLALAPDGAFVAHAAAGVAWPGRWAVREGFVLTAAWVDP